VNLLHGAGKLIPAGTKRTVYDRVAVMGPPLMRNKMRFAPTLGG